MRNPGTRKFTHYEIWGQVEKLGKVSYKRYGSNSASYFVLCLGSDIYKYECTRLTKREHLCKIWARYEIKQLYSPL